MKTLLRTLTLATFAFISAAQAEITHLDYCSEFERRNQCNEYYSERKGGTVCSCPGESTAKPPPFSGTKCSPPNHMTGDSTCCSYLNNTKQRCWIH
jgi:hypothetical protein